MKSKTNGYLVLTALVLMVPGAMWSGYVLSVLWGWFIVPTFEGIPALSIPAAIGIASVVGYLTRGLARDTSDHKDPNDRLIQNIGESFLAPLFTLAFGWVVHLFM